MTLESYVDDEYDAKLDAFVSEHPDVTRTAAEEAFVSHCEAFDEVTNDGTPMAIVRRLGFTQLEWDPPADQGIVEPTTDADSGVGESGDGETRSC